jgi:signal transduction histidine kinase
MMGSSGPARIVPPAWAWFGALAVLATGLYYVMPTDVLDVTVYEGIEFAAFVAILVGVHRNKPKHRVPWLLIAVGVLLTVAGDSIYDAELLTTGVEPESPFAADWPYLAAYAFFGAGLLLLVRRPLAGAWRALLDAAIVVVGIATPIWIYLIEPPLDNEEIVGGELAVTVAYPVLDLLLLAALAAALMTGAARATSYGLLVAGTVILAVTDAVYLYSLNSAYVPGSWLDAGWPIAYALYGMAALHPSMAAVGPRTPSTDERLSLARLSILLAATLVAPIALIVEAVHGEGVQLDEIVLMTLVFVLLVTRLASLVFELERVRRDEVLARNEAESVQRLLAEQNERLRELDHAKDEFLSLVSHDLRTPLTSIVGYLELLLDEDADTGTLTDVQRRFLTTVDRNSKRLITLVNDLLFVARLQAGREPIGHERCDLGEITTRTIEMIRPEADAKDLELTLSVEPMPPVTGDSERLARVVENLLSNALKFTPAGGRISVRVGADTAFATIEVADTGIGIPEEEKEQLFDRFFRASTATKLEIQGTGLGLYMAKSIVTAHKGRISVESEVGTGTTFRVEIPLDSPTREEAEAGSGPRALSESRS